jgi:hypothetical protein
MSLWGWEMAFTIHAPKDATRTQTIRINPESAVARARDLSASGWRVHITDPDSREFQSENFDDLLYCFASSFEPEWRKRIQFRTNQGQCQRPGRRTLLRTFDDIGGFILNKIDLPRRLSPHWNAVHRDLPQARFGARRAEVHQAMRDALAAEGRLAD